MDQETKKLVESLKEGYAFRILLATFAERMLQHLNWGPEDGANKLQGRLNDATAELNRFIALFA